MDKATIWAIYETVLGHALPEYAVPGAENLFEEGKPCDLLYADTRQAYERICKRLGVSNADEDLEIILDSMNRICALVSQEMFRCCTQQRRDH